MDDFNECKKTHINVSFSANVHGQLLLDFHGQKTKSRMGEALAITLHHAIQAVIHSLWKEGRMQLHDQ